MTQFCTLELVSSVFKTEVLCTYNYIHTHTFSLLIYTCDSEFRKVGQFATLEKSQVLGTI